MFIQAKLGMKQRGISLHITFVCTGNTCRSPMAQGLFEKIIKDKSLKSITCSSCGTHAFAGDEANPLAVEAAMELGADISAHKSRRLNDYIINETDLFVCMTHSQAAALSGHSSTVLGGGIADPYGGSANDYKLCAEKIKEALEILADLLIMNIVDFDDSCVDGVYQLEKECFSTPWSLESIKAELENNTAHFLVAKAANRVIAYIGIHEIAGEAYISNIAVSSKYRRKGVASALLDAAQKAAISRNCEFISLEVRKSNEEAISLYKKRGYTQRGERKSFYSNPKEDAIIMTLDLKD